jgi:hypothetical protein
LALGWEPRLLQGAVGVVKIMVWVAWAWAVADLRCSRIPAMKRVLAAPAEAAWATAHSSSSSV